jgi:hypothetical protein
MKDFIIGFIFCGWLLYPMTHLTCFDNKFWCYSLWFFISVFITLIMQSCRKILKTK